MKIISIVLFLSIFLIHSNADKGYVGEINFELDRHNIKSKEYYMLDSIYHLFMEKDSAILQLVGIDTDLDIRGISALRQSYKRARAVERFYIDNYKITAEQIRVDFKKDEEKTLCDCVEVYIID